MVFHSSFIPFYIPITNARGSYFSTVLPIIISFLKNYGHPSVCEVIAHCGTDLHFQNDHWCWTCACGYLYIFDSYLLKSFVHFSIGSSSLLSCSSLQTRDTRGICEFYSLYRWCLYVPRPRTARLGCARANSAQVLAPQCLSAVPSSLNPSGLAWDTWC